MAKKAKVSYSYKTVTSTLPHISKELQSEIEKAGMFTALVWNMVFDQYQYWLDLPKGDPNKKSLTYMSLYHWLMEVGDTVLKLPTGEEILLREFSSHIKVGVCQFLVRSWQSYFSLKKKGKGKKKDGDNKARPPRKKDEGYLFMTMYWQKVPVCFDGEKKLISLRISKGWKIMLPLNAHLSSAFESSDIKDIKLNRIRRGKFEDFRYKLSVVRSFTPEEPSTSPTVVRAIDLGAGDLAVADSNGQAYLVPMRRPDKYWIKRIDEVNKRIDACSKGSRAWKRRAKARQRMHNKSGDQKNDFQRKLALSLVAVKTRDADGKVTGWKRSCDIITFGESIVRLGLAQSIDGVEKQHRGAQNTGYLARLPRYIEEKAKEFGVLVVKIPDPARNGKLTDKMRKLGDAKLILRKACKECGVTMHEGEFLLKKDFPLSH